MARHPVRRRRINARVLGYAAARSPWSLVDQHRRLGIFRDSRRRSRSIGVGASRTALFVTDSRSSFRELAEVARLLQSSGTWSSTICIVCDGVAQDGELLACRSEGIACVDMLGDAYKPHTSNFGSMLRRRFASIETAPESLLPSEEAVERFSSPARARGIHLDSARTLMRRAPLGRVRTLVGRAVADFLLCCGQVVARVISSSSRDAIRRLVGARSLVLQLLKRRIQLDWARLLMRRSTPDLVVLCEDNVEGVSALVVKAAHEAAAAVAIIPNTIATATEPAEAYWSNPDHALDRWSNRLVASLYPNWVHAHKKRALLRLPAASVLAVEWLGLAPPLPWQINSGAADAIVVESTAIKRYFGKAGLPPTKLRLTGTLSTDRLAEGLAEAERRHARLCEQLDLVPGRPIVLSALPPNQLDVRAANCDFDCYDDLVRFWVETLAQSDGWNVVLNLHPRSHAGPVRHFEGPHVRITQAPVIDQIPLCDLFVASVSATIRWAIACSKPVLNFDVYRYGYDDYAGLEGVVTLNDRHAFAREARRMLAEPDHLASLARRQASAAADWGQLDGRSGARLLRLFDELTAAGRAETQ